MRNARRQFLQIPEVAKSLDHRGCLVRGGLASHCIGTLVLDKSFGAVGRNEPRWHATTKAIKGEGVVPAVHGGLGVGDVVRANGFWRRNVVEETASLIVGNQQERLLPLRAITKGLVDLLDKDLAIGSVACWVHGVGVETAAGRVDVGQLRQHSKVGILIEIL